MGEPLRFVSVPGEGSRRIDVRVAAEHPEAKRLLRCLGDLEPYQHPDLGYRLWTVLRGVTEVTQAGRAKLLLFELIDEG